MATILNDAAYMGFPLSIKRGNPAPVDTTAVWYDKTELETYAASGATAYVGQILTLVADGKAEAYMISNEAGTLVKLAQTTASGDLATDVTNLQTQVNALAAKVGAAKDGDTAATGLYALIETAQKQADKGVTDAATAQSAAEAAQTDVDALETVVGADDTAGLRKRIKDNETAIGILNGTGEGSVDKAVKDAIDDFASKVTDDGTINTFKELVDWVAKHPEVAQGLTTEINALKAILVGFGTGEGETATVKKYVDDAIAALKIGDYAKAADLTALAGRVDILEKKPATSITQDQIDAWNNKQDAGKYVDQSAYNTKVKALEDADAANATAIAGVKTTAEAAVKANTAITEGTATKITYDAKGLVTKGENLTVSDIPTLGISKIDGLQDALNSKQATLTFDGKYDAGTNKAATVRTVTDAIAAVIGDGEDAAADNTIAGAKLYADSKASTAESNAKSYADGLVGAASDIGKKVAALESKVDVNVVSTAISTAKTEAITAAGTAADTKIAAAKTAILGAKDYTETVKSAYELASQKTTMTEVENKGYAVKTEVDTAVADAKKAGTDAAAAVTALDAKVGTVTEGKTVVQMISEAQSAATYNDAAVKADIKKNADDIKAEETRATGIEDGLRTDVNAIKADYLKAADKTELQTAITTEKERMDTFLASADIGGEAIDTLKELQDYIKNDQTAATTLTNKVGALETTVGKAANGDNPATGLVKSVTDNATAISGEKTRAQNAETGLGNRLTTLEGDASTAGSVKKTVADAISDLEISSYAKSTDVENTYVKKENGKSLISTEDITRLKDVAAGAQVNKIESVKVNGAVQTIAADKSVDIAVPKADDSSIAITENKIGIKAVNVQKLFVAEGDVLILNGGTASDD